MFKSCGGFGWRHSVKFQLYGNRLSPVVFCFIELSGGWGLPEGELYPRNQPVAKTGFSDAGCASKMPRALLQAGGRCCLKWTIFYFSQEILKLILWHEHLNRVTRFQLHDWHRFTHSSLSAPLSNKMVNNFVARWITFPFFTLAGLISMNNLLYPVVH